MLLVFLISEQAPTLVLRRSTSGSRYPDLVGFSTYVADVHNLIILANALLDTGTENNLFIPFATFPRHFDSLVLPV